MGTTCSSLMAVLTVGLCATALAQAPAKKPVHNFELGRTPTEQEILAQDIAIGPEGKELPPGSGTATQGATLYTTRRCLTCHGPNQDDGRGPHLVGTGTPPRGGRPAVWSWPYATMIYDFIWRSMPWDRQGTLTPDEVYALTAFLLVQNGIIKDDEVMDAKTLPKVKMPHLAKFNVRPHIPKPGTPRPSLVDP